MNFLTNEKLKAFLIHLGLGVVILVLGIGLYLVPLHSTTFYFDDNNSIVNNDAVHSLDLAKIFNAFNTRSLVGLTFALNFSWWGLHPQGFRLTNLLIHGCSAFLVFLLVKATLLLYTRRKPILNCPVEYPAFFASILFLCHPLQTEPVNFITQRFALMGSFLYILSLFFYIQFRSQSKKRYLVLSLVVATADMFCKEFVVTLPLMITLYEFYFFGSNREKLAQRLRSVAPFFMVVLIVPVLLSRTSIDAVGVARIAQASVVQKGDADREISHIDITRANGSFSREQYFLTELNVVCTYIRLLLVPVHQDLDYDYPRADGLDNKTALCGFFLLCLMGLAVAIYNSHRIISFSIFWFFIALSVESSFIPIGHVIAEYRVYLASAGFVLLLSTFIYTRKIDIRILHTIAVAIIITMAFMTYQRNMVWKDEFTLWSDTIIKSPHKARPYNNRGNIYLAQGKNDLALADYNKAIDVDPNYAQPYNNRGVIYAKQKKYDLAVADYTKAIALDQSFERFFYNRGFVYSEQGKFSEAILDYNQAIIRNKKYTEAYSGRAAAEVQVGDLPQALADFNRAIELDGKTAELYNDRGSVEDKLGHLPEAMADYNHAIKLDPKNAESYYNRSYLYGSQGDYAHALMDCTHAIDLNPQYPEAFYNRGIIDVHQKKYLRALADFNQAIKLNPKDGDALAKRAIIMGLLKPNPRPKATLKLVEVIVKKADPLQALKNLALFHYKRGQFMQAIVDFSDLIKQDPAIIDAYYLRGNSYFQIGRFNEAMSDYNHVIEVTPKYPEAYTNRGVIEAQENNFNQALSDYAKAVQLNPKYADTFYNRAVTYYQLKQYDKAWSDVHAAQGLGYTVNPNFITALKQVSGIQE